LSSNNNNDHLFLIETVQNCLNKNHQENLYFAKIRNFDQIPGISAILLYQKIRDMEIA